jgi:GTP-binding protein
MVESAEKSVEQERGRWLFTQQCDFMLGVAKESQLPDLDLPEIAFAGRSNVGKSSLINALTTRKTLARTSNTPGRTREINFFDLGHRLHLVDLPGYGYARAAKTEIASWTQLIFDYLRGRSNLQRVLILIDARHGLKKNDTRMLDTLDESAVSYQIVLTKCDKVKSEQFVATLARCHKILAKHPAAHPTIIATSAHKGTGIDELRAAIAALASWE